MSLTLDVDSLYRGSAVDYLKVRIRGTNVFGIFVRPLQLKLEYKDIIGEVNTQDYPSIIPEELAQSIFNSIKLSRLERLIREVRNIEGIKQGEYYKFLFSERYQRELQRLLNLN